MIKLTWFIRIFDLLLGRGRISGNIGKFFLVFFGILFLVNYSGLILNPAADTEGQGRNDSNKIDLK